MSKIVEGADGEPLELDERSTEPVLSRALVAPVVAEGVALAVSFGADLTKHQSLALQSVLVTVVIIAATWLARRKAWSGKKVAEVLDAVRKARRP